MNPAQELAQERKRRETLERRLAQLEQGLARAEERAGAYRREVAGHASWSSELEQTLRVLDEARVQLSGALQEERRELLRWRAQARDFRSAVAELQRDMGKKDASLREAQQRYEQTVRAFTEEAAAHQAEVSRLMGEIERLAKDQALAQADRVKLLEEVNKAMESAEAVRREGIEALEQARALKGPPPNPPA